MSDTRQSKVPTEVGREARTAELFRRLVADVDVRRRRDLQTELVVLHLPVARSIAWRYRGRGCGLDDLEQAASLALVRAVQGYDADRGHPFMSYAVPCVSGAVKKYFRDYGWTVRPPRPVQELQLRMVSSDPGASTGQLAETLGVSEAQVLEALTLHGCFSPVSLDLVAGDDGPSTLGDRLTSADDRATDAVDTRIVLRPALALLTHDDRSLLVMRFVEERTQQQIADQLGIDQPAVSRLLKRILDDMHATLTA